MTIITCHSPENSTDSTDPSPPSAEIQRVIDSLRQAHHRRDAGALVALYEANAVVYDLAPPLGRRGSEESAVVTWMETWEGPIVLDVECADVVVSGGIAFVSSLNRFRGSIAGKAQDIWFRGTLGLRRGADGWKIAHDHASVPFYMDGSNRAALDLTPA